MAKPFPEMTSKGLAALAEWEGSIPYVYDDAVSPTRPWKKGTKVRGNLTAGVGHLLSAAEIEQWAGKDISQAQIKRWLDADTDIAEKAVHRLVKVKLAPNQRDVTVSFTFNVGVGAFQGSTLLKRLNEGKYHEIPAQLARWNKTRINGKLVVSKGLIARRAHEAAYWSSGTVAASNTTTPDTFEGATAIAEPEAPKTLTLDGISTGAGIVSTIFSSVTEGPLAYAVAGIAVVGFGIAAYLYLSKRLFPK